MKGLRLVLLAAVLGAGAVAVYLYADANRGALPFVASECSVGLAGAAVSVAVEGPTANVQCDSMAGQVTNGGNWYLYEADTEAGGAVICQYKHQGNTWTVRDQGVGNIYGAGVCKNLREMAAGPATPPQTEPDPTEDVGCVVKEPGDCSVDGDLIAYPESCSLGVEGRSIQVDASGPVGYCDRLITRLADIGVFIKIEGPTSGQTYLVCSDETAGEGGFAAWDVVGSTDAIRVCERFGFPVNPEGG